jgi:hypothetical protein
LTGFAIRGLGLYLQFMPRKSIELSPEVADAFVRDMRAYFAAGDNSIKADEIAARQIHVLRSYQGKHEQPIKLHEVKPMFQAMKDHV